MKSLLTLSVLLFIIVQIINAKGTPPSFSKTISKLHEMVEDAQIKETKGYEPFVHFQETKGEWKSGVHFNFFGDELKTEARRLFQVPDSNSFVTNFVSYTLLETERYGAIQISEGVIENAINVILSYHDNNQPDYVPAYTFWPQLYNDTFDIYYQYPPNLNDLIDQYGGFQEIVDAFADIFRAYGIVKDMEEFAQQLDAFKQVFKIPSDADDSGCNLALGYSLYRVSDKYPQVFSTWNQQNSNVTALFDVYLKYAYRPASEDRNQNTIDQRTYYAINDFLENYLATNSDTMENLVLPGTWFSSLTDQLLTHNSVMMPFYVNNVDFSVAANSLFGFVSSIQMNPNAKEYFIQSQDLQNMCISITQLIEYGINSGMVYNRSDLALLYYPSIYDFTWFISRLVYNLEEMNQTANGQLPAPLDYILSTLLSVMQTNATNHLLSKQIDSQYWDDFLGDADTNIFGKPVQYGEDRFFSTALSVNALIDIWTLPNSNTGSGSPMRIWRPETPAQVISAVSSAAVYINDNILDNPVQCENAFFSGSVKSSESLAFFYPSNFCEFFNGTSCDPNIFSPVNDIISGMSGIVDQETYDMYIGEIWCNQTVPVTFPGYNFQPFPYWASSSLSYSISMLALTKYQDLSNQ
ncbi:hypothetical protein DLAC_03700 [Tieghemostelium lacteum]|uniref:Transmembrane protein n=1 Tax=Tieghemostelium lacteum TaxID=361077 RepID=A0A152A0W0_TIELA|nr:hypothetical protein DLAC_03700 [Tieghemostelium lacteum]|eukprot:KYQ99756.1 hypothetical protein DLAC_03700 [Tieghemostelium lacteum]